jgi:hypothetical protein
VENANSIILRMTPQGKITFSMNLPSVFSAILKNGNSGQAGDGTIVPEDTPGRYPMMIRHPPPVKGSGVCQHAAKRKRVWIAWTSRATHDRGGAIKEYLCIGTDITESREMENMMVQTEKMMSVGGTGCRHGP